MAPKGRVRTSAYNETVLQTRIRQTRARSKLQCAPPLMSGLDDSERPAESLPVDPVNIPYEEVLRRLSKKRRIILRTGSSESRVSDEASTSTIHSTPPQKPHEASATYRKRRIILHTNLSKSKKLDNTRLKRKQPDDVKEASVKSKRHKRAQIPANRWKSVV